LNSYADGLGEEPGTELFVVSLDPDDETIVWLYEIFKDEDAENEHRASNGFQSLMQSMPPLPVSPSRGGFTDEFMATGIDVNDTSEVLAWLDQVEGRRP